MSRKRPFHPSRTPVRGTPVRRTPGPAILETQQRLSESMVWDLQRRYYEDKGPSAWAEGGLPWYATSNAFVARGYARVIVGFLADCRRRETGPQVQSLTIVELAAGSGHLSFQLLRELTALAEAHPALQGIAWRLVMTDIADANIEGWERHRLLQPYVAAGRLDFARFDIETGTELQLRHSGETLSAARPASPLVAIANYAFDSTRQDAFHVENGVLQEAVVTTTASDPTPGPGLMGRLSTRFTLVPVAAARYADGAAAGVLAEYGRRPEPGWLLMPIAALQCLDHLLALAGGPFVLLSADKGQVHADELLGAPEPARVQHHGAFSMLVNYHAIGEYLRRRGGALLASRSRDQTLKVVAGVSGGDPASFPETRLAFDACLGDFGPFDYFSLLRTVKKEVAAPSLDAILALFRLGGGDYRVVQELSSALVAHAKKATPLQRREIEDLLEAAGDRFFPVNRDLHFECGRISLALGKPLAAARSFHTSLDLFGEKSATLFNLGLCFYWLRQKPMALTLMERALAVKPDDAAAQQWRERIRGEIDGEGPTSPRADE